MPEGDSVLQLANRLHFMEGREVTGCSFRVPRYATVHLEGTSCQRVWPYGKHLFMQFDDRIVHTHLKMEGTWAIHYVGDRWRRPAHSARVALALANRPRDIELVGHWLGLVEVFGLDDYYESIADLGPDILLPRWDREEAVRRISMRPGRSIGAALLDQGNVAGIGNEYRAEACFIAGVHPAARVGDIDYEHVLDVARRIMWANKDSPIRVTTGVRRAGETTYVFGRNNAPCRRCGTLIQKGFLGGVDAGGDEGELERVIWWCPVCQPAPVGSNRGQPGWR
ncbi:DNA-formamidopyrimidine glycosylase family protein [Corynebacterium flavescens]|uniref:DNA-formamidopyrimidine glycosylase family protein n=1 Tax=Corynebacterium flavescens TaxID=28028 RepID=UPI0026479CBA|nr:DNA-formamidopyrimidine glycosylase family protein [Corynebacterium flavescens]MDN6100134.1 Fpg/Nei family DNA glycosylase [Corynebacterium flavescens]